MTDRDFDLDPVDRIRTDAETPTIKAFHGFARILPGGIVHLMSLDAIQISL